MGKTPLQKAQKLLNKAELAFDTEQYKKAGKYFYKAADIFFDIHEFEKAKLSYFNATKSFVNEDIFDDALESIRNAADAALFIDDYQSAQKFFKNALKFIPYYRRQEDKNLNYVLFSSLSYLCLFIKGKQDLGLQQLKQVKSKVDGTYFKENPLIKLVKNLTIAIRDKNKKYLDLVENDFPKYKFREAEAKLVKEVLVLAKSHVSLITALSLDKDEYTTKDMIKVFLDVDTAPLKEISNYKFHNYQIKELKITDVGLAISDNLTSKKSLNLPLCLTPGEKERYELTVKPHFVMDKTYIGPILFTCEIDGKFVFYLKSQMITPNLVSPLPTLDLSIKPLKTPLIGQSFPLEIHVANNSEGEALSIKINVKTSEKLKLLRGTTEKQVYSLRAKEDILWELSLKATEAGEHELIFDILFNDPDGNTIKNERIETIEINM